MFAKLSSLTRAGTIALGVITAATSASFAAPVGMIDNPALAVRTDSSVSILPVAEGGHRVKPWERYGNRNWRGNREWREGRNWRGDRNWRGNNHWRGDRWRHGNRYGNSAVILGLGLGLGVPAYRYADPYSAPRRAYRSNHVDWCYARYRSYRASDNTFQPNHGPRRQCNSPYN